MSWLRLLRLRIALPLAAVLFVALTNLGIAQSDSDLPQTDSGGDQTTKAPQTPTDQKQSTDRTPSATQPTDKKTPTKDKSDHGRKSPRTKFGVPIIPGLIPLLGEQTTGPKTGEGGGGNNQPPGDNVPKTTEKPPTDNTPKTAEKPPPPDQPQLVTPSHDETTTTENECPQRDHICLALLIDFRKYARSGGLSETEEEDELGGMDSELEQINCVTDYVAPQFKRTVVYTSKYYIGIGDHRVTFSINWNPDEDAVDHNKKEMERINAAIARHRQKIVSEKPRLVIEMVSSHGHGSNLAAGDSYGWWSPHTEWIKNHVPRGSFHEGNYKAIKQTPGKTSNACAWLVYDSSCFSGWTPRAVDTLNNTGKLDYIQAPASDCDDRAGYDSDIAMSTAPDNACSLTSVGPKLLEKTMTPALFEYWGWIREGGSRMPRHPQPDTAAAIAKLANNAPGYYIDNGFHNCSAPARHGYDFKTEGSAPP